VEPHRTTCEEPKLTELANVSGTDVDDLPNAAMESSTDSVMDVERDDISVRSASSSSSRMQPSEGISPESAPDSGIAQANPTRNIPPILSGVISRQRRIRPCNCEAAGSSHHASPRRTRPNIVCPVSEEPKSWSSTSALTDRSPRSSTCNSTEVQAPMHSSNLGIADIALASCAMQASAAPNAPGKEMAVAAPDATANGNPKLVVKRWKNKTRRSVLAKRLSRNVSRRRGATDFASIAFKVYVEDLRGQLMWRSRREQRIRKIISWLFNIIVYIIAILLVLVYGVQALGSKTMSSTLMVWSMSLCLIFFFIEPLQALLLVSMFVVVDEQSMLGCCLLRLQWFYNAFMAP